MIGKPQLFIDPRQLRRAASLGAEIVPPTGDQTHPPPLLEIKVERITFRDMPSELASILPRLQDIEQRGRRVVLIMTHDPVTQELLRSGSKVCWGWTLVAWHGGIYSIQAVTLPTPAKTEVVGEADQGEIYEVAASDLQAWNALMPLRAHASA